MSHDRENLHPKAHDWHERQTLLGDCLVQKPSSVDVNLKDLFPDIIYGSEVMRRLLATVYKVARSHSAVLILGESGTGKELIASAIHRLSLRFHRCFMAINCSAIPENLLEAELFGHEKGAFTGADKKRIGHFAAANEGSVFLDEIGDMPLRLQSKLLRVLQEKRFTPVGGREAIKADIRIIAATNIDLEKAVQANLFRLDLYYRLNVLPLKVPPLRERKEDIGLLLDYFAGHCNRLHPHKEPGWFDEEAKEILCYYDWPGNIRQLQNLVERLIVINEGGRLGASALPSEFKEHAIGKNKPPTIHPDKKQKISSPFSVSTFAENLSPDIDEVKLPIQNFSLNSYIENLENKIITQALTITKNNKNQAAKLLGVNRTTLVERIKKRNITI